MIRAVLGDAAALLDAIEGTQAVEATFGQRQGRPAPVEATAEDADTSRGAGASAEDGVARLRALCKLLSNDAMAVLVLWRARQAAMRLRVPLLNGLLRRAQTVLFGVEIDRRARIGRGVWFVHPVGTVVGGDSTLGDRVRLMGCNTIGTNLDDGYPRVGNDVVVGVGARILGPVIVGDGARIGAGAVVLDDVPPGALALGVPARVHTRAKSTETTRS
jgi:serine O-acetyltransferase